MTITRGPSTEREKLAKALEQIALKQGAVGWFSSSKYKDGTPVAYVAAIQEFGYPPKNIPPRMGLRASAPGWREEWAKVAAYGAKQILKGTASGIAIMELLGAKAESDIRKQIASVKEPELKDSTLEGRASRLGISVDDLTETGKKPLNDTGYMLATTTHAVVDRGSLE